MTTPITKKAIFGTRFELDEEKYCVRIYMTYKICMQR